MDRQMSGYAWIERYRQAYWVSHKPFFRSAVSVEINNSGNELWDTIYIVKSGKTLDIKDKRVPICIGQTQMALCMFRQNYKLTIHALLHNG